MEKEKIIEYLLTDNKSGYKTKKNHLDQIFNGLIDRIEQHNMDFEFDASISFTQKLYNYLYDIKHIPKCETCGAVIKWRGVFSEGYGKNCSKICRNKSVSRLENIKSTNLKKYGVLSVSKLQSVKDKKNETYLNKYGHKNIFQSNFVKQKTRNTLEKKYGVEHPTQSQIIRNRIKENNIKKYGVEIPSKLDSVKIKMRESNLKKYGVPSVMMLDSVIKKNVKSRTKKTTERYKEILGDHVDIEHSRNTLIIKNQCIYHTEYMINNTLFYYRVLVHGIKNPCIHCNPINYNDSIKENELKRYIDSLGFKSEKKRIGKKEIDIYIDELKIGIEYNGIYWHSELFLNNNYHVEKTDYMASNGIKLYHIFEDEWLYKQEITKSLLKAKLGIIGNKIYARKCEIKEITSEMSEKFLNENHLQGYINSSIRIGLFYDNNLVSIMTFSKEKRKKKKNKYIDEYELVRFANKLDTIVIGGASKLLKYFIKKYNPKVISTFADRRYSTGNLYQELGFEFKYVIEPNYWYFNKKDKIRQHRFNFRKRILLKHGFDNNKTEHEIMLERGYLRIYDCGNLKYEMVLK